MRCSGESQQVVDAALLPSAGTQKGYRGTCSSHFIFNPPTFLEMCSELGFAFPFICPCNDFFTVPLIPAACDQVVLHEISSV